MREQGGTGRKYWVLHGREWGVERERGVRVKERFVMVYDSRCNVKGSGKKEEKSTPRLLFFCLLPFYFKYEVFLKTVRHPPSVYIIILTKGSNHCGWEVCRSFGKYCNSGDKGLG